MIYLTPILLVLVLVLDCIQSQPPGYLNFTEIESELKRLAIENPQRSYLYSIGESVEGRELWVLAIANQYPDQHVLLRPEVKFIGGIHGNELPTSDLMLRFISELLTNPYNDSRVDEILDTMRVHVLVELDPDTTQFVLEDNCTTNVGNNNSNNVDLYLNYPDKFFCMDEPFQPETLAVIDWLESQRFLLAGQVFTGGIAVSFPYENFPGSEHANKPKEWLTDDDDVFNYLAKTYSFNHNYMSMSNTTCDGEYFQDGIVNGAALWPPMRGGMEDINYWRYGCYELSLYILCCRLPPASELTQIWEDNRYALIEFALAANTGVRGVVTYENGQPAQFLSVRFNEREPMFKTTELGEFYAILLPGVYNMSLLLNCDLVYSRVLRIHHMNPLVVLNITLNNDIYFRAFYYSLNKYAVFCNKSKAPIDCSSGYAASAISSLTFSFSIAALVLLLVFIFANYF